MPSLWFNPAGSASLRCASLDATYRISLKSKRTEATIAEKTMADSGEAKRY
jgi:hypothetical protein